MNMILRFNFFLILCSFGCSTTERAKTLFLEQSVVFRNEALIHYNSVKPYHLVMDKLYASHSNCGKMSPYLEGSAPVIIQMSQVYIVLCEYRFAFYTDDKDIKDYKNTFKREIDLLTKEIDNFSAQKIILKNKEKL